VPVELDLADVTQRANAAAQQWRPGCTVTDLTSLEGGTVGLVFSALVDGDMKIVIKVAPPGLPPLRNRDVLRQAQAIRSLAGQPGVGAPEVFFTDPGEPNDVPPLFATSFIPGECNEPLLEANNSRALPPEVVRGRALSAARMLAALHRVVPSKAGLGEEPVTTLLGEVERWTRTFETVPDEVRVGYEAAADALRSTLPDAVAPVLVHGDYRLGNMLALNTEVTAIIDWEIWSVSDPRIDLSWFMFFTDEAGHPVVAPGTVSGMPVDRELLETYAEAAGTPPVDMEWFHALTRYKEAATMALIAKLAAKRDANTPMIARFAMLLPPMIEDARRRVS